MTNELEEALVQTDENCLMEMQKQVCPVLDDIKKYKEAIQREKREIELC